MFGFETNADDCVSTIISKDGHIGNVLAFGSNAKVQLEVHFL